MDIEVQCYGPARCYAGADAVVVTLADVASVADAVEVLARRNADLAALLPHCALAVGDEIVSGSFALRPGDQLSLLPPVAGG